MTMSNMDALSWSLLEVSRNLPKPPTDKWPLGVYDHEVWNLDGASLSIFTPREIDFQSIHQQNEIYCVARGRATLCLEADQLPAQSGAALFVAAGVAHRFIDMSDDFAAWVIFLPRGRQNEIA